MSESMLKHLVCNNKYFNTQRSTCVVSATFSQVQILARFHIQWKHGGVFKPDISCRSEESDVWQQLQRESSRAELVGSWFVLLLVCKLLVSVFSFRLVSEEFHSFISLRPDVTQKKTSRGKQSWIPQPFGLSRLTSP